MAHFSKAWAIIDDDDRLVLRAALWILIKHGRSSLAEYAKHLLSTLECHHELAQVPRMRRDLIDESDSRYEERLRQSLTDQLWWKANQYHASDIAFLVRLLDEARAARTA
jgi:hypothetical protein